MDALRKTHNNCKRDLIIKWVKPGQNVLDCGCGRGGDLWKWTQVKARVTAIDPDGPSLAEAHSRAYENNLRVEFLPPGDIRDVTGTFDVVCYNFALHYIVDNLAESVKALKSVVRPGGLLIGITPEKARAEAMVDSSGKFADKFGNTIEIRGERLWVNLSDGPFYADGPREEPLLDAAVLFENLTGFKRLMWEPMVHPSGLISDLYTKFALVRVC